MLTKALSNWNSCHNLIILDSFENKEFICDICRAKNKDGNLVEFRKIKGKICFECTRRYKNLCYVFPTMDYCENCCEIKKGKYLIFHGDNYLYFFCDKCHEMRKLEAHEFSTYSFKAMLPGKLSEELLKADIFTLWKNINIQTPKHIQYAFLPCFINYVSLLQDDKIKYDITHEFLVDKQIFYSVNLISSKKDIVIEFLMACYRSVFKNLSGG